MDGCLQVSAVGCCCAGILKFWRTTISREPPEKLSPQSKALGDAEFKPDVDENGKPVKVFYGPSYLCNLPLNKLDGKKIEEKSMIVTCSGKTLYENIMGTNAFDKNPCFGTTVKPHVFKDAMVDGRPNPKPTLIETPGTWEYLTYGEVRQRARTFGGCLRAKFGVQEREKIAVWAGNSLEWMLTDLSCQAFNFTSVSVYDTLGPNAASFIVADSGSKVLVTESKTFKKVPDMLKDETYASNDAKALEIVVCTGDVDQKTKDILESSHGLKVFAFKDCLTVYAPNPLPVDTPPKPDDIATLMYTSGTTGNPKGVKLTHKNLVSTLAAFLLMPGLGIHEEDVHLSYLPLAHIFERCIEFGLLMNGASIAFASNGSKALLPDLSVIRPTLFVGVPKVYENVRDAVARKMTGLKKKLYEAALKAKIADIETGCGYSPIWDKLVFNKTKLALGGRVRYCISGGAPISKDTLQFVLCALGLIVQGYGATETSAAATLSHFRDLSLGHVGPPMPHASVRLVDVPEMNYFAGKASDYASGTAGAIAFAAGKAKQGGEVWVRGHGVSPGYYDPSVDGLKTGVSSNGMKKKTAEDFLLIDGVQTFRTGDIGTLTESGCLKIVDRRKNMFKTALGEYVPVEEVEKTYQDNCSYVDFVFLPKETKVAYVAMCCVVSDSIGPVMSWAKGVPELTGKDASAVVASPQFKAMVLEDFKKAAKAKKLPGFLQVQKLENLHLEFQPAGYQESWVEGVKCANGHVEQLLTATFKARRSQLDQYYAPVFPTIYPDRPADHILP